MTFNNTGKLASKWTAWEVLKKAIEADIQENLKVVMAEQQKEPKTLAELGVL